jgi:hypothetical protein
MNDPQETAEVLLSTIAAPFLKGERRTLMLSNRASTSKRSRLNPTVAINGYAEKALGNRDYFLNKPYGVG